jgi:hypothetical protein
MAPRLTRMQDCGWTSADVPEITDKNASVTLRDSVDLSLSYSPEKLLSVFISEYQPSLGLQPGIITLLNASWLVTVRCFCPVQDIHLGRRSPGVYFITRLGQAAGPQVAIELNCEAPVKNLVRDVSLLQSGALSQMAVGDEPSDEASDKFLTTTICYAEGKLSAMGEGSSNGNLNAGVYISVPSTAATYCVHPIPLTGRKPTAHQFQALPGHLASEWRAPSQAHLLCLRHL